MDIRTNDRLLESNLSRTKGLQVNEGIFAFLLAEIIQYNLGQVVGIVDLEDRLAALGYEVGLRLFELQVCREKTYKRETRIVGLLSMIHSTFWRQLIGRNADSLEISKESEEECTNDYFYSSLSADMIVDNDFPLTRHIAPPREMSQLCCASFMAGIVEAMVRSTGFDAKVSAHSVPQDPYPLRTVFLIRFSKADIQREKGAKHASSAMLLDMNGEINY